MRDILFRAKRLDNGEWAESKSIASNELADGGLIWYIGAGQPADQWTDKNGNMVSVETRGECLFYACDPETIGQFTGLTDNNGNKIFEGDIVEGADFTAEDGGYGVVSFVDVAFEVNGNNVTGTFHENYWGGEFEVIGNIHDNPELLEGE